MQKATMSSSENINLSTIKSTDLLSALNELLEAERAGARSTLETLNEMKVESMAKLVMDIQQDEVRWCKMLINAIHLLGEEPSRVTGSFYEKVMAISDLHERLLFINRGQSWVVKRLVALIPRVGHENIKKGLQEMLEAHKANIQRVEKAIH